MAEKKEGGALGFLYGNPLGRLILKCISARWLSRLAGHYMDSRLSRGLVKGFVRKNAIDLSEYEKSEFDSFNDFFTRKIKAGRRPFDMTPDVLPSPCDGLVSAYNIDGDTVFPVKQSSYTVDRLLNDKSVAGKFYGGVCLVVRLCVDNYHRYAYIDGGTKEENHFIKGKLHTVRPVALAKYPVFTENCREWTLMHTDNFGDVCQCEVGAMLVGKIANRDGASKTSRGAEKGMFLYGGSTVVLLFEKGKVALREEFFSATENGAETPVKMGECIGRAL